MFFRFIERNPFFFTVTFLLFFMWAGLIDIIPNFYEEARPVKGLKPLTVLQTAGKQLYIKESCNACHSQLIRPFKNETDRYGAYSLSGEYAYDRPFLWGSKRTGPDLHRVGDVRTTEWHEYHMKDPKSVVPASIMPGYPWMFKHTADFETAYAEALTQKKVFNVPYDKAGGVKLGSIEEAKKAYVTEAQAIASRMKDKEVIAAAKNGDIKEIIAITAYLNSLNADRRGGIR